MLFDPRHRLVEEDYGDAMMMGNQYGTGYYEEQCRAKALINQEVSEFLDNNYLGRPVSLLRQDTNKIKQHNLDLIRAVFEKITTLKQSYLSCIIHFSTRLDPRRGPVVHAFHIVLE